MFLNSLNMHIFNETITTCNASLNSINCRSKMGGISPFFLTFLKKKKISINKSLVKFSEYKTENNNTA